MCSQKIEMNRRNFEIFKAIVESPRYPITNVDLQGKVGDDADASMTDINHLIEQLRKQGCIVAESKLTQDITNNARFFRYEPIVHYVCEVTDDGREFFNKLVAIYGDKSSA